VTSSDGQFSQQITTDSNGEFTFTYTPTQNGTVTFTISGGNMSSGQTTPSVPIYSAGPYQVIWSNQNASSNTVNQSLTITAQLLDSNNTPVPNFPIAVSDNFDTTQDNITTNSQGDFSFTYLPTKTGTLTFSVQPGNNISLSSGQTYTSDIVSPLSSNTSIQDTTTDNSKIVTGISGSTINVVYGTTDAQLKAVIQSTDGSTQRYAITNALTGTLASGDTLQVTAANGKSTATYTIRVAAEVATTVSITIGSPTTTATTVAYLPTVTIIDQNGNAISNPTVTWSIQGGTPSGVTLDSNTGAISIEATTYTGNGFTLVATDGTATNTATVSYSKPASVPTSVAITVGSASTSGTTTTYQPTAQVLDQYGQPVTGQTLTWSLPNAVTGVSVDASTGQITIDNTQATTGSFQIQAADGSLTNTTTVNYTHPSSIATSDTITLGTANVNSAGTQVTYTPSVVVDDQYGNAMTGQTITWSIQGGTPSGVTLNSSNGTLTIDSTTYTGTGFTLTATDGSATNAATVSYTKPTSVPTSLTIALGTATTNTAGTQVTFTATPTVLDQYGHTMTGASVTWGTLPSGVNMSGHTITIDTTSYTGTGFTVTATDGSASGSTAFTYTKPSSIATSDTITLGTANVNSAGTQVTYTPSVVVDDQYGNAMTGQTITWSIQGGTPSGVTLNSSNGTLTIDSTTYTGTGFTLTATDGSATNAATVSYTKPWYQGTAIINTGHIWADFSHDNSTEYLFDGPGIYNINPSTGAVSSLQSGPTGFEANFPPYFANGEIYIDDSCNGGGGPGIYEFNPNTDTISTLDTTTATYPTGSSVYANGYLYTPSDSGDIYITNVSTGTSTALILASGVVANCATYDGSRYVYVSDTSGHVYKIDTTTNQVVSTISIGNNANAIVYNAGNLYIAEGSGWTSVVQVINTATNSVTATISIGSSPKSMVIGNGYLYIANESYENNSISVVDLSTNAIVGTISIPSSISWIVNIDYVNSNLYVATSSDIRIIPVP
jgi:YVTN family beta-propeller protein